MQLWNVRWARYAVLGVLLVAGAAAISEAHFYFRFWWYRPPTPAIQDVDFDNGTISFANLRSIVVTSGVGITQNERIALTPTTDPDFVASVVDSLLSIGGTDAATPDPIVLSSSTSTTGTTTIVTTTTNVEILLDPVELRPTYFSSLYRTTGVAIGSVEVVETDIDTGDEVSSKSTPVDADVRVFGSIQRHLASNTYRLRGSIRAFDRDTVDDDRIYTILSLLFNAEGAVPAAP